MTWNITRAPWITILQPRTADIVVLLVDLERDVFKLSFCFVCNLETRCARADDYHPQRPQGVEWLFCDLVPVEGLAIEFIFVGLGFLGFGGEELGF